MLGEEGGQVLYPGKAKNIKTDLFAYSHIDKLPVRLQRMVSGNPTEIEFIVVGNRSSGAAAGESR